MWRTRPIIQWKHVPVYIVNILVCCLHKIAIFVPNNTVSTLHLKLLTEDSICMNILLTIAEHQGNNDTLTDWNRSSLSNAYNIFSKSHPADDSVIPTHWCFKPLLSTPVNWIYNHHCRTFRTLPTVSKREYSCPLQLYKRSVQSMWDS